MADFRREYGITETGIAAMGSLEFHRLLRGLSKHSRWMQEWRDKPKTLHDPAERAELRALALR